MELLKHLGAMFYVKVSDHQPTPEEQRARAQQVLKTTCDLRKQEEALRLLGAAIPERREVKPPRRR